MKKRIVFLALLLSLLALPYLTSSPIGTSACIWLLNKRSNILITAEKGSFSWKGPQKIINAKVHSDAFDASFKSIQINAPFWKLLDPKTDLYLQNGTCCFSNLGSLDLSEINGSVAYPSLELRGKISQEGSFQVSGTFVSNKEFALTTNLQAVPTSCIDLCLHTNGVLCQLLGPQVTLQGSCQFHHGEGKLLYDLDTIASLDARIQDGILKLNAPFTAQFKTLSSYGLWDVQCEKPAHCSISPNDFQLQIYPLDLTTLQIGSGTLDFGKMQITSQKTIPILQQLFKNHTFYHQFDLWLTPIPFALHNQILQMGRIDGLLANVIPLCSWGDIHLTTKQVHMYLGLPQSTLEQMFSLHSLPRECMLKVPIRGPIDAPQLDLSSAMAKIAAMLASQKLAKITGFSIETLIPEIMKEIGSIPPSSSSLPWEK